MTRDITQRRSPWSRRLVALAAVLVALTGPFVLRAVPVGYVVTSATNLAVRTGDAAGGADNEAPRTLVQQHATTPSGPSVRKFASAITPISTPHGLSGYGPPGPDIASLRRVVTVSWRTPMGPASSSPAARAPPPAADSMPS